MAVVPDGGAISLETPTPGSIAPAGEVDEWTFTGHQGRSATIEVNSGSDGSFPSLAPYLDYAQFSLMDAGDKILATASTTDTDIVTLSDIVLPSDGTYRIEVQAPSDHKGAAGNYMLSVWDVTPDVAPLTLDQDFAGRIENLYSVDRWTFSATANQQMRFHLVNATSSGIAFDLTGPAGWTGFSNISADSDLITLPASGDYLLTAHGTGGQFGGTYTACLVETAQSDLALGTVFNGSLASSGQAQLFRVVVPASDPMRVVLDDTGTANHNELYVKCGAPPTRADYDYRSIAPLPDQQVLVPMARAGTWYILVYGESIPQPDAYTLTASLAGVQLAAVTPDHYANTADAVLTLSGAGFDSSTVVELVTSGGTAYRAANVLVDSFTQITATFAAGTIPAGEDKYSLRLSQSDGDTAQLVGCFTMINGGEAHLETSVEMPPFLGRHAVATIYVDYRNTGNVAMLAPLLILGSSDSESSNRPLLTLDYSRVTGGLYTSAIPEGFDTSVQFLASGSIPGVLQPGESGRVAVYYAGLEQPWDFSNTRVELTLGALGTDDTTPVDWNSLKDSMRPAYVRADAWNALWSNFTNEVGSTWGSYVTMLDDNAQYLDRLGEDTNEITRLLGFGLRQADGLNPIRYLAEATDAQVQTPGMDIIFSRAYAQPISRRYEIGLLGRGWADNWQWLLQAQSDGTVWISDMTGTPRIFQPDSRYPGQYLAAPGDSGKLTQTGGEYSLYEQDGTVMAFLSDGRLDYIQDTNGDRTTCGYSGSLLTSLTASSGPALQLAYNAAGRLISITDPAGRQTQYTYDTSNEHLISARDYDGQVTQYTYLTDQGAAREHALSQIAYPDGTHRYFTYDSQGRLAGTSIDGNAEPIQFSYDSEGTVTAADALADITQYYFDDWGTIVKTTNALGNSVMLTIDSLRNVTGITDPAGRTFSLVYDSRGDVVRCTDAMGAATKFTYTTNFNELATLTDANGNTTQYSYDSHGNLTAITSDDGSSEHWAYDPLGEVTQWTNARGQVTSLQWDGDGNLTRKTYADGTHEDYVYDGRDNLLSATDSGGTTTFTYDANDYLTRIDYPGGQWLQFTYDAAGRRVSSIDQLDDELVYHYDAAGRLGSITDETGSSVVQYAYDAVGRLSRKALGNGVYTTYAYDAAGELLQLTNCAADGSVLSSFTYAYDSRGRCISMVTSYGTWTYQYDDPGQLTQAVLVSTDPSMPSQDLRYVYDAMGNRVQAIENGEVTDYAVNNMNQYIKTVSSTNGQTTYTFDPDGNLVSETSASGATTYSYDQENRLIAVHKGTDSWTYQYNPFGQRAATTCDGTTTQYVVDPIGLGNVVGEYDGSDSLVAHYNYGFDLLSRVSSAGVSAWYTFDALGNTSELTNATGATIARYAYAPFGAVLQQSGSTTNPFKFVGAWGITQEGNGLESMRIRCYAPILGRFVQADPVGVAGGVGLYRYAVNNPIAFADSSGLCPIGGLLEFLSAMPLPGGKLVEIIRNVVGHVIEPNVGTATGGVMGGLIGGSLGAGAGRLWGGGLGAFLGTPFGPLGIVTGGVLGTIYGPFVFGWLGSWVGGKLGGIIGGLFTPESGELNSGEETPGAAGAEGFFCGHSRSPAPPPKVPITAPKKVGGGTSGSRDPNDKSGPAGLGSSRYVDGSEPMLYRIDFENDVSATAPAQQVNIADQLDSNLDWSTFSLAEIGFGDQIITIPANTQHYATTVHYVYNGVEFDVQIDAGIYSGTGQVYANFYSIDPATGLPPTVDIGFLPPEDGTGRGMGHISYTVKPKAGLPTGTEIRNIAQIQFDLGEIIPTNQIDPHDASKGTDPAKECPNTIDAGTPTSSVASLPAEIDAAQFTVSWSGQDDAGGSGIASYDIYVSDNGGAYGLWKEDITDASAPFTGQSGHTYAFYSVATDNVGHQQAPPSGSEAQTRLSFDSPPVAAGDTYSLSEDHRLSIGGRGVLSNDSDPDGDAITAVKVTDPAHGLLELHADGSFVYTPQADYCGSDSFTYRANDGRMNSDPATVSITVTPVNDPPDKPTCRSPADGTTGVSLTPTLEGVLKASRKPFRLSDNPE